MQSMRCFDLTNGLEQKYLMERAPILQNADSHCRYLTCCKMHADAIRPNPVHLSSCLASSCVLRIHVGAPAGGRPPAFQRRMQGCQMMGMHLLGSHRRGRVGMLWIRCVIFRPFGTSPMPVCPFILEPHF